MVATCGDGAVDLASEECDDGNPDCGTCSADCLRASTAAASTTSAAFAVPILPGAPDRRPAFDVRDPDTFEARAVEEAAQVGWLGMLLGCRTSITRAGASAQVAQVAQAA